MSAVNAFGLLSLEETQLALLAELGQKLEPGQTVVIADGGGSVTVDGPLTDAQLRALALAVSGTVALDAATLAALESISATVTGTVGISGTVSVSGPLTDAQLRAAPIAVTVSNPDEAGLTDAELRSSPVPVSGSVAISNFPGPDEAGLTDVELRASAVPVSGPLTDAQLRALAVAVSGVVDLSAATLSALETINAIVSGTVAVSNFPATQPVSGTVVVSNPTTNPETGLAKDATVTHQRGKFQPGVRTTKAGLASSAGDNVLITPTAGKRLRVYWLGLSSSETNSAEVLAIIKFGAAGLPVYRWRMGFPGAFSHWEPIEGELNESFVMELSAGQGVDWNVTFEEFL